jgi:hypothetical protein
MNTCVMSDCRLYRYTWWPGDFCDNEPGRYVQFIGLNPSTADEKTRDPTVRRCIQFAKDWGFTGLCMTNLFAYRATDPKVMKQANYPVGACNDEWLQRIAGNAGKVVAAWGNHGRHHGRDYAVKSLLRDVCELQYLKLTKAGIPQHPLYLKADTQPRKWA